MFVVLQIFSGLCEQTCNAKHLAKDSWFEDHVQIIVELRLDLHCRTLVSKQKVKHFLRLHFVLCALSKHNYATREVLEHFCQSKHSLTAFSQSRRVIQRHGRFC